MNSACATTIAFAITLGACKPNPSDAPSGSERLKALEAKTEKIVEEKVESLEERFRRERVKLVARFQYHLKRTEGRIAELKKRAELDAARRPKIERIVVRLEQRSGKIRERIGRFESATADQWDQLKAPWQKKQGYEDYENQILKETEM
jgi:hypothetical protein